mmetsp:Transcript_36195/g.41615  ORF Transcript_36195/g.41615 Transcript_36195/m.41615 type:complete len:87 (+) Transcript_36195:2214-2474(+)
MAHWDWPQASPKVSTAIVACAPNKNDNNNNITHNEWNRKNGWDGILGRDWETGRENMGLIWKEFLDNLLKDATTHQHNTKQKITSY